MFLVEGDKESWGHEMPFADPTVQRSAWKIDAQIEHGNDSRLWRKFGVMHELPKTTPWLGSDERRKSGLLPCKKGPSEVRIPHETP